MAKFIYRMQSLLDIQYQLEDQAKMELGRAQLRLPTEEERRDGLIARKEELVEEARRKLTEVMQERKMHERLKEKALEQFRREELAAEGKAVDELTSYVYGQRGKEE